VKKIIWKHTAICDDYFSELNTHITTFRYSQIVSSLHITAVSSCIMGWPTHNLPRLMLL